MAATADALASPRRPYPALIHRAGENIEKYGRFKPAQRNIEHINNLNVLLAFMKDHLFIGDIGPQGNALGTSAVSLTSSLKNRGPKARGPRLEGLPNPTTSACQLLPAATPPPQIFWARRSASVRTSRAC